MRLIARDLGIRPPDVQRLHAGRIDAVAGARPVDRHPADRARERRRVDHARAGAADAITSAYSTRAVADEQIRRRAGRIQRASDRRRIADRRRIELDAAVRR